MDIPSAGLDRNEIESTIRESIRSTVEKSTFLHSKVDGWIAKIMENCLKRLAQAAKQYKYVVSCQIMQKSGKSERDSLHTHTTHLFSNKELLTTWHIFPISQGAGACVTSTYSWDARTDDYMTIDWQNDHILCIVSVYWLAV